MVNVENKVSEVNGAFNSDTFEVLLEEFATSAICLINRLGIGVEEIGELLGGVIPANHGCGRTSEVSETSDVLTAAVRHSASVFTRTIR